MEKGSSCDGVPESMNGGLIPGSMTHCGLIGISC